MPCGIVRLSLSSLRPKRYLKQQHLQHIYRLVTKLCIWGCTHPRYHYIATFHAPDVKMDEKKHRELLEDLLLRKFFFLPSFEIYGGVAGLYDFGPPGCAVQAAMQQYWRRHFILEEQMLEIACTTMTPEAVLKASGHVERFTDFMVRDEKTGDCFRADKLLEEHIDSLLSPEAISVADLKKKHVAAAKQYSEQERNELLTIKSAAGSYQAAQLSESFKRFGIVSPETRNSLSEPFAFNLMFQTSIGPTGKFVGYLRPETAQGMFVNFRRLLDFNAGRIPFAAAQIGLAFRNEIAPRSGLLRLREFTLAEIEHFVNPKDKRHPRFKEVADVVLALLPREDQHGEEQARLITVGAAVNSGVINNETLGYFLARTQLFLEAIGVKKDKLRFRQHKSNEMAHYAADCWDAEIYMHGFGWIECVGHADRSAYDLRVHSERSKVDLVATELYDPPIMQEVAELSIALSLIGKTLGKEGQPLIKYLKTIDAKSAHELEAKLKHGPTELCINGKSFIVNSTFVTGFKYEHKKISSEKYTPHVIEPAFGLGRILYGVLDHSFYTREGDEKRGVLGLPVLMAPTKLVIAGLSGNSEFDPFIERLTREITRLGHTNKADTGAVSIGRKYARADELGTPYAITIDFDTVGKENNPVTIRERDSTKQVQVSLTDAISIIDQLLTDRVTWDVVYGKYPQFLRDESE